MVTFYKFSRGEKFSTSLYYKNLYIGYEKTINPKTWNIL